MDGAETHRLVDADAGGVYETSGQLLFIRQGTLFAQSFDSNRLALVGDLFPVAEQIEFGRGNGAAPSASKTGTIVYRTASTNERQFVWSDRSGKELERIGEPDSANPSHPALSPDGRQVALHRSVNGQTDVWLLDLNRAVLTRFTTGTIWQCNGQLVPRWEPHCVPVESERYRRV